MSSTNRATNGPLYSCPACLKWFPANTAIVSQKNGWKKYFCSSTCQSQWETAQENTERTS